MKVVKVTDLGNLTADHAVTLALNNATVCDGSIMVNVETEVTNGSIEDGASNSLVGQDSNPVKIVQPRYLPRAKQGCKGVVVIDAAAGSHSLASVLKEFETYSWLQDGSDYVIWGTINYDQIDDDYTPLIGAAAGSGGTDVFAFWH